MRWRRKNGVSKAELSITDAADGQARSIEFALPPDAILLIGLTAGGLIAVWFYDDALLTPICAALATTAGLASAFYARQAIRSQRIRERRKFTIEFSHRFSCPPLNDSRAYMATTFQRYKNAAKGQDEAVRTTAARNEFSQAILQAFDNRGSEDAGDGDEDLMSATRDILDYFEDLGVGLAYGVFDEAVAKDLLSAALKRFWNDCSRFVTDYREQHKNEDAYQSVQFWNDRWSGKST